MTIQFMPVLPVWVITLVAMGLLALLVLGSRVLHGKRVPNRWIVLLGLLRVVIVGVLVVCLLQPVVAWQAKAVQKPELLVLVDASKSMAATDTPAGTSRIRAALDRKSFAAMMTQLTGQFNVCWFAFDEKARAMPAGRRDRAEPSGDATSYASSLLSAYSIWRRNAVEREEPVAESARVLFISDGNDRGEDDPAAVARRLGLTVDVLAPPSAPHAVPPPAAPSVRITGVQNPRHVFLNAELRFLVRLRRTGTDELDATISLSEDGRHAEDYPVTFGPREQEKQATVSWRPERAGVRTYTLAVRLSGESAPTGAPFETSVQVINRRCEVLVLEDTWRWSLKYLRREFENDPNFSFTAFVSRGRSSFVQLAEPDRTTELAGFPQNWAELAAFDIIVLGDVDPSRWPDTLPAALHDLVVEGGKSLILIAGPNLARLRRYPELESLLPVHLTEGSARPAGDAVRVRMSLEGRESPLFFRPEKATEALWRNLPPMDQIYPPLHKKPGATVLLEAAQHANDYGNLIVMAEQTVGRGRSLYIGTDTLWKWQMLGSQNDSGLTPHTVFWQQTLRSMAPEHPDSALVLQPVRHRCEAGQTVRVRARLRPGRIRGASRIRGVAQLPGGNEVPLAFAPDASQPDVCEAAFEAPSEGRCIVTAAVESAGKTAAEATAVIDVQKARPEEGNVDRAALARLANGTGGLEVDPDDPQAWPSAGGGARSITYARVMDLWNNFTLLSVLAALLGIDWLLRLGRGYF